MAYMLKEYSYMAYEALHGFIAGMQPDGHHRSQECYAASPLAGEVGVTQRDNWHTLVADDTSGSGQKERR